MKLEAYGFISDTQSGALVGSSGSIDWLCLPRFDAEACFASLLGDERNGCWRIAPKKTPTKSTQSYRGDTLILETLFQTEGCCARVIDFMPPGRAHRNVVRIVEGLEGTLEMEMKITARFNYGQTIPWVRKKERPTSEGGDELTAIAGPNALVLRTSVPTFGEDLSTKSRFSVAKGERKSFVLTWHPAHESPPESFDPESSLAETEAYWSDWAAKCTYQGEWRGAVLRSLLTLKGLTFSPTGGIMAALTTSLPEKIGGVRNWDYRYCWLRDATFTLYAFMHAGYTEEAAAWSNWLLRAVAGDPSQLQIMYGAAGERRLNEFTVDHLPGYENSAPVRVGNAAAGQFQLDVYGEVLAAMHLSRVMKVPFDEANWPLEKHLVDFVEANWRKPDEGIWEIRGPRRHFTHSKVMAWVAVDRALRSAEDFGLEGDVGRWRKLRQTIHDDVCEQGFNSNVQSFTQYYGSEALDASLLLIPLVGFLPTTDPRVRATIERIEKELMIDGYVVRYLPEKSGAVDGLPPGEGAFLPCSFWLVDCLHFIGRTKEARCMFERLMELRTPLGLLSEEYDVEQKRLVGNFPQAFSHISLISAARNLSLPPENAEISPFPSPLK